MADAELVLRYFSLRDAIENERLGSLRRILDRFMKENANADDAIISKLEDDYISFLKRLLHLFNEKPFCLPKTNRPSRPLYDALMIALSQKPDLDLKANAAKIKQRLKKALENDREYDTLVGRGNTIEAIRERVELASKILASGQKK